MRIYGHAIDKKLNFHVGIIHSLLTTTMDKNPMSIDIDSLKSLYVDDTRRFLWSSEKNQLIIIKSACKSRTFISRPGLDARITTGMIFNRENMFSLVTKLIAAGNVIALIRPDGRYFDVECNIKANSGSRDFLDRLVFTCELVEDTKPPSHVTIFNDEVFAMMDHRMWREMLISACSRGSACLNYIRDLVKYGTTFEVVYKCDAIAEGIRHAPTTDADAVIRTVYDNWRMNSEEEKCCAFRKVCATGIMAMYREFPRGTMTDNMIHDGYVGACASNNIDMIKMFADTYRITPTMARHGFEEACKIGNVGICEMLIPTVYVADMDRARCLCIGFYNACYHGHNLVIDLIMKHSKPNIGLEIFSSGFIEACRGGHHKTVEHIMSIAWEDMLPRNSGLMIACQNGHLEVVQLFYKKGDHVDLNFTEGYRLAREAGHYAVFKLIEPMLYREAWSAPCDKWIK